MSSKTDSKTSLISRLAKFLRLNGEKVINGTCKLSLTTSALCTINTVFVDLLVHDRVEGSENCPTQEFLEDAQFLFDFIKKTRFLKLFHGVQTVRGGIDVSHFKGLTALELRKIPSHLIVGLNTLPHLKALTCNRSIGSLKELFGSYTEENRSDGLWLELRELNVSCNYLENLDSLRVVPNIEILDASHNSLKHVYELMVLDKLVVLKLSYNMLSVIPPLNKYNSLSLRVLLIRNNNLESLSGLDVLINLEELDVSYNCLSEYVALKSVASLKFLKVLHLENNPVSQCKQYRELVAPYFHPDIATKGIVLDGKKMSAKDIQVLQSHISRKAVVDYGSRHQTSIIAIVEDKGNVTACGSQPYRQHSYSTSYETKEITNYSPHVEKESSSLPSSHSGNTDEDGFQSKRNNSRKFRKKMREAIILPLDTTNGENASGSAEVKGHHSDEKIPSHILTKRLIETRRKEYGSEWLIPSNPFQAFLIDETAQRDPTKRTEANSSAISDSQHQLNLPLKPCVEALESQTSESHDSSSQKETMQPQVGNSDAVLFETNSMSELNTRKHSVVSDDIQVLESSSYDQAFQNLVLGTDIKLPEPTVYEQHEKNKESDSDDEYDIEDDVSFSDSEEENEDRIFLLERKEKTKCHTLFVCIGKKFIKEKLFKSGRLYAISDLSRLLSIKINEVKMDETEKCEIILTFDAPQASNQKRVYVCDEIQYAKQIASILQPFADAKAFEDAVVGALQCLKCRSEFSRQVAHLKVQQKKKITEQDGLPSSYDSSKGVLEETTVCPNCGSNLVVELEDMPLPSAMLPYKKGSSVKAQSLQSKKSDTHFGTPPALGQISSMLYSMIKYPKTKKTYVSEPEKNVPFTSVPKPKEKFTSSTLSSEEVTAAGGSSTADATTVGLSVGHDVNENVIEGMEQTDLGESTEMWPSQRISRNSSDVTIQSNPSQSSIAVISSDSDCDMPLDVIPERDSLCSPAAISPLSQKDFENDVFVKSGAEVTPPSTHCSAAISPVSWKDFEKSTFVKSRAQVTALDWEELENVYCESGAEVTPKNLENAAFLKSKAEMTPPTPPYQKDLENGAFLKSRAEVTPPSIPGSPLGYTSDEEFQDCKESFSRSENTSHTDESSRIIDMLSEKEIMDFEKFSCIDHRLKLFLEFTIFGKDEELDACLEIDIVNPSNDSDFRGLFVFSSKKIYIMKLVEEIGDDVARCVQKLYSCPLNQLKVVRLLPGSQGFAAIFGSDKIFVFLVQDSDCCNCFISCITDNIRQRLQSAYFPRFENSVTEALDQIRTEVFHHFFQQTTALEKEFEVVLYLLLFWCDVSQGKPQAQRVALTVTSSYLFVAGVSFCKQFTQKKQAKENPLLQYRPLVFQKLSNLVEIQVKGNLKEAMFNFLDEQNVEFSWRISAQSKSSLFSLVNALKNPWETLFGISLPVCLYQDEEAVTAPTC